MKKIILLASVITVASFASCKKTAKCECTTTVTSYTENGVDIAKTSKKTAAAICGGGTDVQTSTYTSGSTTYTDIMNTSTTCAIK